MSAPRVSVKQGPLFPKKLKPGRLLSTTATPTVLWRRDARPMRRSSEGMWRIHCLTGGVCSGCWPSPPIWPRYLLKELTCLRGLAGTGVPDGMCMCVVCRLSFSQINVKFVKKRGGGGTIKQESQKQSRPRATGQQSLAAQWVISFPWMGPTVANDMSLPSFQII